MAEAILNSVDSFNAQSYSESFFASIPSDGRFLSSSFQKFPPDSTIDGRTIVFTLNRFQAANIYLIQDCCLEIVCSIHKKDGSLPLKSAKVAPNCNVLHTAFEAVRVFINDQSITANPSLYNYKSYILNTLTYSAQLKTSLLESQGYYGDTAGFFDDQSDSNSGFYTRNKLFRKNLAVDSEYLPEGTRFFGKLNLDLVSCETGLVPGTKVRIELDKAPSAFVLTKSASDAEQYSFKISDINIYVPVAQLSDSVFRQLSSIFTEKSVSIHFRKTEILEVSLPKSKVEYFSDNIFTADVPCKVIVW